MSGRRAGRYFEAMISSDRTYAEHRAKQDGGGVVTAGERGGWVVWRHIDLWDAEADGDLLTSAVPLRYFEATF